MADTVLTDDEQEEYLKLRKTLSGFLSLLELQKDDSEKNKYLMLMWKKIDAAHELFKKYLLSINGVGKDSTRRLINIITNKMTEHLNCGLFIYLTQEQQNNFNEYYRKINLLTIY